MRIHPPEKLALIPAQRQRVVAVLRSWLPCRLLSCQNLRESIVIGQLLDRQRLINRYQAGLMREELPNGDLSFARLGKFWPVLCHGRVEAEQSSTMSDHQRRCRHSFRDRKSQAKRVFLPRLSMRSLAAPQIDDLYASMVNAAGGALLAALVKIPLKRKTHRVEISAAMALNVHGCASWCRSFQR